MILPQDLGLAVYNFKAFPDAFDLSGPEKGFLWCLVYFFAMESYQAKFYGEFLNVQQTGVAEVEAKVKEKPSPVFPLFLPILAICKNSVWFMSFLGEYSSLNCLVELN